jgi:hypothetical protein
MSRGYTALRTNRRSEGLWPLSAEPGPDFRWGAVLRRSAFNRKKEKDESGKERVVLTEESTNRQERAIQDYVKANSMGRVVAFYTDIASAYNEKDKREDFKNAWTTFGRAGSTA